jgi:hypothetical protein
MQDNKTKETAKPRAMILLEAALLELSTQLVLGDTATIAKKAKMAERTIIRYIKESYVPHFNTGKKILDIGRALVAEREKSLAA